MKYIASFCSYIKLEIFLVCHWIQAEDTSFVSKCQTLLCQVSGTKEPSSLVADWIMMVTDQLVEWEGECGKSRVVEMHVRCQCLQW